MENNQAEHQKTLVGKEAIDKLKDLATSAENCFFCTNIKTGLPLSVRPMSVLQVDEDGNLWFMSAKDSHKYDEIKADPFTHLFFQENKNSGFLNIYGITEIVTNQEKIDELWNPLLKVWFEDKDDANICLLKVEPTSVYYWDNKHGDMVAFAKMMTSLIIGKKNMDDSVEGKLEF